MAIASTHREALADLEQATRDHPHGDEILRNALLARVRHEDAGHGSEEETLRQLWRVNSELAVTIGKWSRSMAVSGRCKRRETGCSLWLCTICGARSRW